MAAKSDMVNSVIGEGSVFEGRFYISGSLQIDGKFEGEIKTEDQLFVGETGKVKTDVTAKRVIIAGTFIGNIEATEEVRLLETGRMLGNITAPAILMEKGVVMKGMVNITGGQKKDIKSVVEESYQSGPSFPGKSRSSTSSRERSSK